MDNEPPHMDPDLSMSAGDSNIPSSPCSLNSETGITCKFFTMWPVDKKRRLGRARQSSSTAAVVVRTEKSKEEEEETSIYVNGAAPWSSLPSNNTPNPLSFCYCLEFPASCEPKKWNGKFKEANVAIETYQEKTATRCHHHHHAAFLVDFGFTSAAGFDGGQSQDGLANFATNHLLGITEGNTRYREDYTHKTLATGQGSEEANGSHFPVRLAHEAPSYKIDLSTLSMLSMQDYDQSPTQLAVPSKNSTNVGSASSAELPNPSLPFLPQPQAHNSLLDVRAMECTRPPEAEIGFSPTSPSTTDGRFSGPSLPS
ncbi:hypothetical protein RJ639_020470 [Escallonia herrerae]|uniref:Uncharacterized protein n=1 Tax=Escallonia herrerae TaxID=1293975 RepID=A0AA88V6B8_9ASTE|nr:hypothetical protein RJ639_020470 [Escallonia herrerae]